MTRIEKDIAIERDKNHLFKFHVGDVVRKAWRWLPRNNEDDEPRFCRGGGSQETFPIGTTGIISVIFKNGMIILQIHSQGILSRWHVGASELDLIKAKATLPSPDMVPDF